MIADMMGVGEERKTWRVADPDKLEEELSRRFGRVTRSQGHNGLELICDCPVCGERKLTVNAVNGIYKCWRGCCSGTVRKLLNSHVPMVAAPPKKAERKRGYIDPGEIIPLASVPDDNPASVYLKSRGFDPHELGATFGFGYCRRGRKFAQGVFDTTSTVMAAITMGGKGVGWQSRLLFDPDKLTDDRCAMLGFAWSDKKQKYLRPPKYFTMPGMNKGEILWNYDNARKSDTVVVTEGVYDAARAGKCGVACLGKDVSDYQINLLQQYWRHVILLLDPDAQKDADRTRRRFAPTVDVIQVRLEGYKDAGECPRKELWSQIFDACAGQGVDPCTFVLDL